jgi:Tfp pilus assembly protein PilZ
MWADEGVYDTVLSRTVDIGLGGLCVRLNQAIRIRTKVDIKIDFSDRPAPLKCKGSVVRCHEESKKVYNIGVQFEPLTPENQAFLAHKIDQLIQTEQKGE